MRASSGTVASRTLKLLSSSACSRNGSSSEERPISNAATIATRASAFSDCQTSSLQGFAQDVVPPAGEELAHDVGRPRGAGRERLIGGGMGRLCPGLGPASGGPVDGLHAGAQQEIPFWARFRALEEVIRGEVSRGRRFPRRSRDGGAGE